MSVRWQPMSPSLPSPKSHQSRQAKHLGARRGGRGERGPGPANDSTSDALKQEGFLSTSCVDLFLHQTPVVHQNGLSQTQASCVLLGLNTQACRLVTDALMKYTGFPALATDSYPSVLGLALSSFGIPSWP